MNESTPRRLLNEAFRTDMSNSVLCWLATVDQEGMPNVTPKEIFASYGNDTILIADIASTGSVRNIKANPKVCVSLLDIFRQRGFKVNGRASIVEPQHPDFGMIGSDLLAKAGPSFPIRNIIRVTVDNISRIWAPSYALFPEKSEQQRIDEAYATYGVCRRG
jgi:predicted pyridoxine 5'-phosphate oxidase superfamily flavin-nucleotide-binding protein